MQTITLKAGESVKVVIEGAGTVLAEHVAAEPHGNSAIQIGGVDCDLAGDGPGFYYVEAS